jgi:hypothetical protein
MKWQRIFNNLAVSNVCINIDIEAWVYDKGVQTEAGMMELQSYH